MATDPTFTLAADPREFEWNAQRTEGGDQIERGGWVNTDDPGLALKAIGLPEVGDPYDPIHFPECKLSEIRADRLGGKPLGDGTGGVCRIRLLYRTPSAGGNVVFPVPNTAYTELAVQVGGVEVNFGVTGDPWQDTPINNGDGTSVETGLVSAAVHVFIPSSSTPDFGRLISLCSPRNKINDGAIVLPKVNGTNAVWNLAAMQARYRSFSVSARGSGVTEVVHQLVLAQDHDFYFGVKGPDGRRNASGRARVYDAASFAGLWP